MSKNVLRYTRDLEIITFQNDELGRFITELPELSAHPFQPFTYIQFWERRKISCQNPLWHGYLHISHRRQKQRPPICQEMKGLADTEGSLTLQPLTATGIHNLPAMNPFTYQEGVSLSKKRGYGGQQTGGKGKKLHDLTWRRFQTELKACFRLACLNHNLHF